MNNQLKPTRVGRARVYPSAGLPGFASDDMARLTADLTEFHERVTDQIHDLPDEALNYIAAGTQLSIGWVVTHLAAAEASWIATACDRQIPRNIEEDGNYRRKSPYGEPPPEFTSASGMVELINILFREFTLPTLQAVREPDRQLSDSRLPTVRDVIRHLNWHWVFHSGHIGLIRLQWGSEYEWTFAEEGV